MKVGIDSYCYHRFFGEVYPEQSAPVTGYTMDRLLGRAKELGCDGVSLESCFFPGFSESYLRKLRGLLDGYEFDRVYAWGHPDGLEAGGNEAAKRDMIAHIEVASLLGAKVMRVVGSSLRFLHEPHGPQLKILAKWFKEAVAVAEERDIKLAVENHIDYNSHEILQLIDAVGSDHFGVNLDTANFLRVMDDPVEATERLKRHIYATHIKDVLPVKGRSVKAWNYFASVAAGEGLVAIDQIAAILEGAGYEGFLAFETDMPHPSWENNEEGMIEKSIQYLKKVALEVSREPAHA